MPTKPDTQRAAETLVDIQDLSVHFDLGGSTVARLLGRSTGTVKAVDGINLTVGDGEVVGVVGESGSGKSTLGRSLLGLAPATSGVIDFKGIDVASLRGKALRAAPPERADDLPGSQRGSEPGDDGRAGSRRPAAHPRHEVGKPSGARR